ncbi:MAG: AcrR family transcriptional regulator [Woeseiaceae bacterium]|jgi:AcrR family transcriptional regulator
MPKIVDHEAQRITFANAAINLIAREGLEGVTMRAVAAEAGLSYGSLFHYFKSKDDLLMHVVRQSMASQTQRVNDYANQFTGMKALERLLCDDAIINESSRDSWLVWLTFLYKAALQKPFAEMHADLISGWLDRIQGLLRQARDSGEIRANLDVEFEAKAIWAFSAGVGQMGLLDPGTLPEGLQKTMISAYLDKLRSSEN